MNDLSKPTVATNAEFTSASGDVLLVANGAEMFHIIAAPRGPSLLFPHADAPAIALAILTAAGVTSAPHDDADSVQLALAQLQEWEGIRRNQAAQQELTRRRDELALQLIPIKEATYSLALPAIQRAVDMIIQLQDQATQ